MPTVYEIVQEIRPDTKIGTLLRIGSYVRNNYVIKFGAPAPKKQVQEGSRTIMVFDYPESFRTELKMLVLAYLKQGKVKPYPVESKPNIVKEGSPVLRVKKLRKRIKKVQK